MKHYSWMAVSALLLGFMMFNLTSCSKDDENGGTTPTETEQGGKDDDQPVVVPDVVVTVDDSGQADGGHRFQRIDDTNFYIDDIKYTAEKGDLIVTGYNEAFFKGAAVIISTLKYQGRTMDVTSIKDKAFRNCTVMTLCVIGNKVTSIGYDAFYGCSGLTSVTIGSGVTSIGESAFGLCSGLTSVTVDNGNSIYDSRENCNAIIETASNTLIAGCMNTTIPSGVTSIGHGAFAGCSGLTSVTIPSIVTSIGKNAFASCSGLTSVTINSNSVISRNYSYYSSDRYLKDVFGEQVKEYILGDGVTSIGHDAFYGCTGLTSVTIPSSVTSIEERTFYGCSSLTSVTIPSSVTSIGHDAFGGCSSLTSVTIPSSVTSIAERTFSGCSGLTSVTIPSSVTRIRSGAFSGCSGLTSMTVDKGNSIYDSRENCNAIIETASNTLIAGCMNTTIPSSVTSIGHGAFSGCSSLTSVTIPSSVTSIGVAAFFDCSGLTSLIIPNSVTSIGDYAFYGCSGLTSVTIPSSVTSIGDAAFAWCSGLRHVYCYAVNPPSGDSYSFDGTPISSATLHVPAESLDAYKATSPWSGFGTIVAL